MAVSIQGGSGSFQRKPLDLSKLLEIEKILLASQTKSDCNLKLQSESVLDDVALQETHALAQPHGDEGVTKKNSETTPAEAEAQC